jgi:Mg2+-importing ATPase
MILSITMAKGSIRMAEKGVIVKRLSAIPNFGSMDILCTDKTGTLTQDKIELVKYTDVYGNDSSSVLEYVYLNSSYQTGIRNPMDEAVLNYKELDISDYVKVDEIPFDFFRKKMSVVVKKGADFWLITKGAPEEIFKVAPNFEVNGVLRVITESDKEKIVHKYQEFSKQGYRVLALGVRKLDEEKTVYSKDDERDLTLIGFVSFFDPPKTGVKEVLEEIHAMGVEVKIITGDNELVTLKIAEDVGLVVKGVLFGYEIDSLTDDALRVVVEKTTVFARFSPDEKNRIITALKLNNHVVGYMGDGINDAPSLKTADVGISVNNAVDVAKEAAAIILTHKSLRELKSGIQEGRRTFANTLKYIMMGISSNFGNMFSVIGAVIFLPFFPMLPIQILLNNLLYDFSQITIPSDDVDEEYTRSPKRWNIHFIKRFMYLFGPISSCFDFVTFFILYAVLHADAQTFQTGWFLESLATQTLVIHIIRTRRIPFLQSRASKWVFLSTFSCVVIGWILPYTALGRYFGFIPLPLPVLFTIASIVLVYMCIVEFAKRYFYRHNPIAET